MKPALYFIFAAAFFIFVTCTAPNARGESSRISRFELNTSSMQEKEKMKYALGIIGLPDESDITQYSVADLGRSKNRRIMEVKRKVELASQFLLKCLVETINENIENAVEDQFTFSNQQFTTSSDEKSSDVRQPIAVGSNFMQTSQLAVTQAQQGSSFSGNVAEYQVSNHFIGPNSSTLLPQLMTQSFSGNNLLPVQQEISPITALPSSSGNVMIPQQNTSIYTGPIPSIQFPPQAETNPGINSTLLENGLSVQQVASVPSNAVENVVENGNLIPQIASVPSNAVENFTEIQHYSPQAISILPSDFAENEDADAEKENFAIDKFDSAETQKSSSFPEEESNNSTSFSGNNLVEQSQTIQPEIASDSTSSSNQSKSEKGRLKSKSRDSESKSRERLKTNEKKLHEIEITSNLEIPENTKVTYVSMEFYLTKGEATSNLIEKEFIYTLDRIGNFLVTLKLSCLINFEHLKDNSIKKIIRLEFRKVKPQNLSFRRLKVNYYLEEYEEYISKKHYFSRLKPLSSSSNDILSASQKCSDIFIIKVSLDESKTGFIRSYNLHKYGLFSIAHNGPIADNTFLVSTEFEFCALVINNSGSVFDFKKVNNPTPIGIISTPVLTDHHADLLKYYLEITDYVHPPKSYEIPNLIRVPYKLAVEGFTFTNSGTKAQMKIKSGYALNHPEEMVAYQINLIGNQTKYNVLVDKSPDLIRGIFYEPLKVYASQHNKDISYGDLVFVFQKKESTQASVMLITADDGIRKFALTIPPLQPNFYFVKGLGKTDSDYLVIHIK